MVMIFFNPGLLKEGEVILCQLFEEGLLTHPSDLVAAAGLLLSQDAEVEAHLLKDLHQGLGDVLGPGIVGRGATHIE